jgi:protein TonB
MESLSFAKQRIPRKDLVTGIGTSILVHVLAFSTAFIWALVMPHKPLMPPFCTVNLVSLKDLGAGSSELKGNPKAAQEAEPSKSMVSSDKAHQKSEAVEPIKRLTVDEATVKPESQIKKIEPKEVPVAPEKPQSLEAIEKNLDKLIAKPKEVPHTSSAAAQQAGSQAKTPAQAPPAQTPAKSHPGTEMASRGTPTGAAEGGAKGAEHGSSFGSPDGNGAITAAAQVYVQRVVNAIKQEFKLPDQNFSNLEAKIFFVVNREGKVLSFQVEKPAGNSLFDGAAVRAIQNANIPPMPQVMEGQKTEFRLRFSPQGVS